MGMTIILVIADLAAIYLIWAGVTNYVPQILRTTLDRLWAVAFGITVLIASAVVFSGSLA